MMFTSNVLIKNWWDEPDITVEEDKIPKKRERAIGSPVVIAKSPYKPYIGLRGFIIGPTEIGNGYTVGLYEPYIDSEVTIHTIDVLPDEVKADRSANEEDLQYISTYFKWYERNNILTKGPIIPVLPLVNTSSRLSFRTLQPDDPTW